MLCRHDLTRATTFVSLRLPCSLGEYALRLYDCGRRAFEVVVVDSLVPCRQALVHAVHVHTTDNTYLARSLQACACIEIRI